jgi:hypothetical protein
MKQKDFFENFLPSGFGEIMLFHFWYNEFNMAWRLLNTSITLARCSVARRKISVVTRNALFIYILFMSIESSLPPRISFLPHLG